MFNLSAPQTARSGSPEQKHSSGHNLQQVVLWLLTNPASLHPSVFPDFNPAPGDWKMGLASPFFLAHCCSFSLLFPPFGGSPTHPEDQAVGDEKSLQTGDHRLRLEPPRRWRHAGQMALNFNPKRKRSGWNSALRPAAERRGKKSFGWNSKKEAEVASVSPYWRRNGKRG